jgi:hypothetical protein
MIAVKNIQGKNYYCNEGYHGKKKPWSIRDYYYINTVLMNTIERGTSSSSSHTSASLSKVG